MIKTLEQLGYQGDVSWRSCLYAKFNDEKQLTQINIDLEIPQHTRIIKTITNNIFEKGQVEPFTAEEIKAVNKIIDELIEMYKISELGWEE